MTPTEPHTLREDGLLELVDTTELVELTRRLVRVRGENPPGQEEATAREIASIAADLGLETTLDDVAPGRPNLQVDLPGAAGPGLLLLGHSDVVPVGDGWTVDPFGAQLRDGRIYGRGASDMKAGLAACLVAMAALRRSGAELGGPVRLAVLADEEQDGIGVRHWIARPHPEYLGCIVAEPTELQTIVAARGACYLDVTVTGRSAHSGRPADGRNAINGAAVVIAEIERWHAEFTGGQQHPLVGTPTFNVGVVAGGSGPSIVPAECVLRIDRRSLPSEDPRDVLGQVRTRLAGLGLEARGLSWTLTSPMDMPGFETPAGHPLVEVARAALADAGGPAAPPGGWTAACDGGFVARHWDVPVVVLGPGSVNEQAHRPDESVGVEEIATAARTYALIASRLLT